MNAIRSMYEEVKVMKRTAKRTDLYLVSDEADKENSVLVNGKMMTKDELNEKMTYFYEHGGPVMDI